MSLWRMSRTYIFVYMNLGFRNGGGCTFHVLAGYQYVVARQLAAVV